MCPYCFPPNATQTIWNTGEQTGSGNDTMHCRCLTSTGDIINPLLHLRPSCSRLQTGNSKDDKDILMESAPPSPAHLQAPSPNETSDTLPKNLMSFVMQRNVKWSQVLLDQTTAQFLRAQVSTYGSQAKFGPQCYYIWHLNPTY